MRAVAASTSPPLRRPYFSTKETNVNIASIASKFSRNIGGTLVSSVMLAGFITVLSTFPGQANAQAPAKKPTKIRIVSLNSPPGFLMWAAKDLGFYEKEGLDVESFKFVPSGPAAVAAGYAGAWDAAYLGGPPAINAGSKFGLKVAGLLDIQQTNYKVYVRKEAPTEKLAEYLKGKTALTITASNLHYFLDACLRHHKADPTTIRMVNLTPPNIVTAANAGQGEIISDWAPFTAMLEATGRYRPICESNEQVGIKTFDAYVIHPAFAKANPEASAAFIRAVYRVNALMVSDYPRMLNLAVKYFDEVGVKLTPEHMRLGFEVQTYPTVEESIARIKSGEIRTALEQAAKFLVSVGAMESVPQIDFVTSEFLEAARASGMK